MKRRTLIIALTSLVLALTALLIARPWSGRLGGREITWTTNDGVELKGTLVLPKGERSHPLVIFVPGSGCTPRSNRLIRDHALELSARGIAVFVYDKRGCGDSGGSWRDVGLDALAEDFLAVVPTLCADPSVDADRITAMGISQGGWITLIAAERSREIAAVWLSGTSLTPAEQGSAIVEMRMQKKGFSDEEIDEALALDRLILEVYRTDSGWDEARAAVAAASNESWFEDSGVGIQPRDSWNWRWLREFMDYDAIPVLRAFDRPLLAVFGELDRLVPAVRSKRILDELEPGLAARDTVMLPDVGHQLRSGKGAAWSTSYWDMLAEWVIHATG